MRTKEEFNQFLKELEQVGFVEEVEEFRKVEKEVEKEMEKKAIMANKMIEHANLVQIVETARKEGRIVHCRDKHGNNIIH